MAGNSPPVFLIFKIYIMTTNAFKYSLKVWLTSILITPIPIFILPFYNNSPWSKRDFIESLYIFSIMYLVIILLELLCSFITWIAFWLAVHLITISSIQTKTKFRAIFLTAICLSIITSSIFLSLLGFDVLFLMLAIGNCACIGWRVWHHRLDIPTN
jgi:hypothetical protein